MYTESLLVTLCVIGVALASESPVILFGVSGPTKASLHTITANEFAGLIKPLSKDHMIVAFQEEDLTPHDLSCKSAQSDKQSCYAHLQSVSQKTYYQSVKNPASALELLDPAYEVNSVGKNGKLEAPVKCGIGKVLIVTFNDAETMRSDALEAHDVAMASVMKQFSCPAVFLYMSTPSKLLPTKKRTRRDVKNVVNTATSHGGYMFRDGANFLLFFTQLSVTIDNKVSIIEIESMAVAVHNTTDFTVTLTAKDGKTLTFDIELKAGYYYMKQLTYDKTTQFRSKDVNAQPQFSYYCGNLTLYASGTSNQKLTWNSLQFQAPFGSTKDAKFIFGDSWNCVGFFTPAILAGLFVVVIMLAILFTGICWMMDINTMDRFDDPKGKTITINANE